MRVAAIVVAVVASAALPAQARKPADVEQRAISLINRATQGVLGHGMCSRPPQDATVTHDAPTPGLLALFAILRRPATAEDALSAADLHGFPGGQIYIDYIRLAHAADGHSYWIVPVRDALQFKALPKSCLHRVHTRLRRLSRGQPVRVRRRALHFFNQIVKDERRLARRKPTDGMFVFDNRDGHPGGGGGGTDPGYIATHGLFSSSGTSNARSSLSGLLPDGVATVTSTFGTKALRGPHQKPRRYPKRIVRTDKVQDNMVSLQVPRSAEDAFPAKMVWRDGDGKVVRVVRLR